MDLIPLANDCVSRCEELVKRIKYLQVRDAAAPEQQKLAHARAELESSKESLISILAQLYQKAKHIEQACNDPDACRAGLNNDERKALFRFRVKYEKLQHEGDGDLQSLINECKLLSIRPFHTSHTHQVTEESFEEDTKRQQTAWTPKTYRPILIVRSEEDRIPIVDPIEQDSWRLREVDWEAEMPNIDTQAWEDARNRVIKGGERQAT